jgi:uncharacterized protein
VRVEVGADDRYRVSDAVLGAVTRAMQAVAAELEPAELDDEPYAPGRAFVSLSPPRPAPSS